MTAGPTEPVSKDRLDEAALDLISEIKLKAEDLASVSNTLLIAQDLATNGVPGLMGDKFREGSLDLMLLAEAQFKIIALDLQNLIDKLHT